MIDKKTFTIGVLSVTALVLLVANLMLPQPAAAEVAVKDRDYTAVTGNTTKGGDALFLTDNRTGMMAVFIFDPNTRSLKALDVQSVSEAFAGGRGGDRPARRGAADREGGAGRGADRAVNR
jgi:hypothetical protein